MYLERIHLEIIRQVEQQGSMTAAASALHLTQSALSHSMRKLENQLGVKLWDREGRQLKLTQAGAHLLESADRLIPKSCAPRNVYKHTPEETAVHCALAWSVIPVINGCRR